MIYSFIAIKPKPMVVFQEHVILPVKEMVVTNIYFTMELDGFFSISISYIKNGIEETVVLSQVEHFDKSKT